LKIIANSEGEKCAVIGNAEVDIHCYKEVLTEMKTPRI
jgi:hypothetical protein